MQYRPGTHIIATFKTQQEQLLQKAGSFRALINSLVNEHGLEKLGEVYHDFSPSGFTAVICLSESHISIHTWPEHQLVNLDIYLSNFERNNNGTVAAVYEACKTFFSAEVLQQQTITR